MLRAFLLVGMLWTAVAQAGPLPDAQKALFLSLAHDVSGGDPIVMAQAERLVAHPPTEIEEIGFFGMKAAPDPERSLRGIISALDKGGHLVAMEDKYVYELSETLQRRGFAKATKEDAYLDFLAFFDGIDRDAGIEPDWELFKVFFVAHTKAIEQAVARSDGTLLELHLPAGDTLYYWIAPPELAQRWRNKPLYFGINNARFAQSPLVEISVREPDWMKFWLFLTYALNIPPAHEAAPDGL